MPVRRHIQEEESPQIKYETNQSALSSSINSPILKSYSSMEVSLRQRKKNMFGANNQVSSVLYSYNCILLNGSL